MKNNFVKLLNKEIKLASSPLSYIFVAFSLMVFIPGYPITVGPFFVCLGLFYTFQNGRESDDIIYSVLLPIAKRDVVTARFVFVVFIQLVAGMLMLVFTVVRMTLLKDAVPYVTNPLQNANLFFIAYSLLIFSLFNLVFVRGYFRTGYYFAKPFLAFIVLAMIVVIAVEVLHHIPGLMFLSETGFVHRGAQLCAFAAGVLTYALTSFFACRSAQRVFERIDL